MPIIIQCRQCRTPFSIAPSRKGKKFYCSAECYAPNRNAQLIKDGDNTRFRNGHTPASKDNPAIMRRGVRHPNWKGDTAGYRAIHYWVKRQKGSPTVCSQCGIRKTTPKSIQWANISGEYRREISDYTPLCASCHKIYDLHRPTQ